MKTQQRAEVLINVHKGLRRALLGLDLKLGSLDREDKVEVEQVGKEFVDLLHFLREHAANENEVQIPMLEDRVPGAAAQIHDDHHRLETQIDALEKQWVAMAGSSEADYGFYLAYNRFLSNYLAHMDREETEFTEVIYQNFTDPEIEAEFKKIIARTTPTDMGMMLGYMLPGMNNDERVGFLGKLKNSAPAEVFAKVWSLTGKVLSAPDMKKISTRLGF